MTLFAATAIIGFQIWYEVRHHRNHHSCKSPNGICISLLLLLHILRAVVNCSFSVRILDLVAAPYRTLLASGSLQYFVHSSKFQRRSFPRLFIPTFTFDLVIHRSFSTTNTCMVRMVEPVQLLPSKPGFVE